MAPDCLAKACVGARALMGRGSPLTEQHVIAAYMKEGYFETHIRRIPQAHGELPIGAKRGSGFVSGRFAAHCCCTRSGVVLGIEDRPILCRKWIDQTNAGWLKVRSTARNHR